MRPSRPAGVSTKPGTASTRLAAERLQTLAGNDDDIWRRRHQSLWSDRDGAVHSTGSAHVDGAGGLDEGLGGHLRPEQQHNIGTPAVHKSDTRPGFERRRRFEGLLDSRADLCGEIGSLLVDAESVGQVFDLVVQAVEGGRYVEDHHGDPGAPDLLDRLQRRGLGVTDYQGRGLRQHSLCRQETAYSHHRQPDRFRGIDGGDVGRHHRIAESEFPYRLGQVSAQRHDATRVNDRRLDPIGTDEGLDHGGFDARS